MAFLWRDGPPGCQSPLCGGAPNRAVWLLSVPRPFSWSGAFLQIELCATALPKVFINWPDTQPNKNLDLPHADPTPLMLIVHYQWPVAQWADHSDCLICLKWAGSERASSRQSHLCCSTGNGTPGTSTLCLGPHHSHDKFLSSLSRRLLWHSHGRRPRSAFPGLQVRRSASPPQQIRGREEEVGASSGFPGSDGHLIEGRGSGGNRLVLTQELNSWIIDRDSQMCPWLSSLLSVVSSCLLTASAAAGPVFSRQLALTGGNRPDGEALFILIFLCFLLLENGFFCLFFCFLNCSGLPASACFKLVIKDFFFFFMPKWYLALPLAAEFKQSPAIINLSLGFLKCYSLYIAGVAPCGGCIFISIWHRSFSSGFWPYFLYWLVPSTCGPVFSCAFPR